MGILNYLPTFKVVEPNRLTGLITGQVLSQFEAGTTATKAAGTSTFIENGIILGLSNDLTLENFDKALHAQPLLHFTEELVTFLSGNQYYALEVQNGVAYPRAIGLYVGDSFTTDNYDATVAGLFAKVVDGVLTLQAVADGDTLFVAEASTLPTGGEAYKFTYIGQAIGDEYTAV